MITKCAGLLTNLCISKHVIQENDENLYQYGFELIISILVNIFWVLTVGVVFKNILMALISFVVFASVRTQCGGYHAKTYFLCNFYLIIVFVNIMMFSQFIYRLQLSTAYIFLLIIIISFLIYAFFQFKKDKQQVDAKTKSYLKKKVIKRLLIWEIVCVCDWIFGMGEVAAYILITLVSIYILMLVEMIKEVSL